jgi:hypothetical protein
MWSIGRWVLMVKRTFYFLIKFLYLFSSGCHSVKSRNLLENLQFSPDNLPSTPPPPPFQDFITLVNTKKRTHTSLSISSDGSFYLPHQTPSPLLDHTNHQYTKIRARPLYNFKYNEASIWTQSSSNATSPLLNNLQFDVNVVHKFFAKETKQINKTEQRSRSSSMTTTITRPFQILDKSSKITYDVTMRHLLQLLAKNENKKATIDDVLSGIETGNINNEW